MKNQSNQKIDGNFYSRQIGTYGLDTMSKIIKMNIFIYGMRGVGIETAKNIILSGPKSLTIFDPYKTKINDLSSNYFLKEEDAIKGKRRDESCFQELSKLNPYVKLNIMEGDDIIKDIYKKIKDKDLKYDVLIITEFLGKEKLIEINELCRVNNIGFILSLEFGIFGFIFVDFGNEFIIQDETGEETKEYLINYITKDKNGKVFINNNLSGDLKFTSNDLVSFKEIEGMTELNNCNPRIISINGDVIEIGDTSQYSEYKNGGVIFNVKLNKTISFESFKERVEEPFKEGESYNNPIDIENINIQEILHIGLLSLFDFYNKFNYLPEINNSKEANELFNIAKNIFHNKKEQNLYWVKDLENIISESYEVNFDILFEKNIKFLSNWAKAQICPISSFIGGVTAQEIIKHSGKYKPIHQWLYCDFSEIVDNLDSKNINRTLNNSRYDDQIAIFGNDIQKKIENTNIFMVGAGALGCEFLKTFAMMGIATENNNKLYVTDNDNIEISNLNRQFLFNKTSIGHSKSKIACESIKKMNNKLNCIPFQTRVCPENEDFFDEEFWNKQDYIINAVDNIKAREYIAKQSLIYKKILIDSGTLGTKANSQIMIPHKTIPYSPPEEKRQDSIPMCTLADHPFNIIHCIEWARDNFNGYFVNILKEVKMFLENKDNYYDYANKEYVFSDLIKKLQMIFEYSKMLIEKNFEKCLEIALNQYNTNFYYRILDLISQHGKDSLNEEGTKYWTGDKRFPHPLPFDSNNKYALLFVKKYAQILGTAMSIPIIDDDKEIIKIISNIKVKEYTPKISTNNNLSSYSKKKLTKEEKKLKIKLENEKVNNLITEMNKYFESLDLKATSNLINIKEFEKDNDDNGHIEFLYAFTNLRAENYDIQKCDISKVKLIAGKIVPAIASTTAAIVGLVALQIYILNQEENIDIKMNSLRNCYFNFALNTISFEKLRKSKNVKDGNELIEDNEKKFKLVPPEYSIWDYIVINNSLTLNEFIKFIKNDYKVDVTSIISNNINLYLKNYTLNNTFDEKIEDIYNKISKIKLFENKKYLILEVGGEIDNFYAKMPLFKYNFK